MRIKIIYLSIFFLLIAGIIVWFNFDWFNFVSAAGNDSNTVSLLHMNGTDGSTTFTDSAAGGTHTWTASGNAQIDTAYSKFGGASGLFDGTGDYLSTPDSEDWNFGTGDFTIDGWFNLASLPTTGYMSMYQQRDASYYIGVWVGGNDYGGGKGLSFEGYFTDNTLFNVQEGSVGESTGTWYHFAAVRYNGTISLYKNGVSIGTPDTSGKTMRNFDLPLIIGSDSGTTRYFDGSLDELRVSKGIARWTANFTPPGCEYNGACPPPPKVPDIMIFE